MKQGNLFARFLIPLKEFIVRLFTINDTPHKVALGLGLGIACGILPGVGPVASLFVAWVCQANKASAFLGCLMTNTWLSFVTFFLSIKVGSAILTIDGQAIARDWQHFLTTFHWRDLLQFSAFKIVYPVVLGYIVIAFILGVLVYGLSFLVILLFRHRVIQRGS